jgi:hypothetical protein
MFQDLPNYFTIPDKRNNDLHRLLKENILGDPSIVLHRYNEKSGIWYWFLCKNHQQVVANLFLLVVFMMLYVKTGLSGFPF